MIDKTTVEVIRGALVYAAEEMGIALKKSAYSPNIKERMDHSCALFEPRALPCPVIGFKPSSPFTANNRAYRRDGS
jgi:hypothetical protein